METLLRPAKVLAEWDSCFAQGLETYFSLLKKTQNVNFSEAALVLQNSANVYVRRVEYLCDEAQALNQSLSKQSEEKNANEKTGKDKKNRKSKSVIDFNDFESLDLNTLIGKSNNLKEGAQKNWKLLTRRFTQLENNLAQLSSPIEILSTQGEVIGKKYDFRCNQHLNKHCMLVDELTPNDFSAAPIAATSSQHESSVVPTENQNASFDSLFESNQSATSLASPVSLASEEMDTDANGCADKNLDGGNNISDYADAGYTSGDAADDSPETLVTRNPTTEGSTAIETETCAAETQPSTGEEVAGAIETQSTPTTENSSDQALEPIPFDNGVPDTIPRRRKAFKLPCHVSLLKSKAQSRKRKHPSESKRREYLTRFLLDKYDLVNRKLTAYSPTKQLFTPLKQEELEEFQRSFNQYLESMRGSESYQYDAVTRGVAMELLGFQPNFTKHDPLTESQTYSVDSTVTDSDTIVEPESDLASVPESFTTPPPTPEAANHSLNYRELVEQRMRQIGEESREQTDLEQRVAEWHRSLRPKLTAAGRRPPFQIDEYSSRIIKSLEDSRSQKIPFDKLVRHESPAEVARYFLASLQLANSYNVEINTGRDSGCGIELKLLEKETSHDSLNLHKKIDRLPRSEVSNDRGVLRISTT